MPYHNLPVHLFSMLFAVLSTSAFALDVVSSASWGGSVNSIRLGVVGSNGNATAGRMHEIVVCIQNESKEELAILNLGSIITNGKIAYFSTLGMRAIDAQGSIHTLQYALPVAMISGRRDPMIIPLLGGSTYVARFDLARFIEDATGKPFSSLPPGAYKIVISLEAAPVSKNEVNGDTSLTLLKYWIGNIQTGELAISIN